MLPGLLVDTNEVEISLFLQRALDIVIGIEFIKMLAKHSPGSALEVLLYAIARHMIVGHESAVENFISVASIALIFFVRKFLFVPAFRWILHSWSGAGLPFAYHHPRTAECVSDRHGQSGFQKFCRYCRLSYLCRI